MHPEMPSSVSRRAVFVWTCLLIGTRRVGHGVQHDLLVGATVVGAIVFAPLTGGIVALLFGYTELLVPALLLAVLVIVAVFGEGAYQCRATDDSANAELLSELNRLSRLGRKIRDDIRAINPTLRKYEPVCRSWANDVHVLLAEQLPYKAEWFLDEMVEGGQQAQPNAPFDVANWGNYMDRRLTKLAKIIKEMG